MRNEVMLAILIGALATTVPALTIPLTVTNRGTLPSRGELARGGVPMPLGKLKSTENMQVLDAERKAVPTQFTVLNRWPADGSIRWVLLEFPVEIDADQTKQFTLVTDSTIPSGKPAVVVKVNETPDNITVDTGPLRFTVRKNGFALFDTVSVVDRGLELPIAGPLACLNGFTIVTTDGSTLDTIHDRSCTVKVEEAGPLRVTLLAEGRHTTGTAPTPFSYQVRIHATAGSSAVRVQYVLTNDEGKWPDELIDIRRLYLSLGAKLGSAVRRFAITPDGTRDEPLGSAQPLTLAQYVQRAAPDNKRYYEGPAVVGAVNPQGMAVAAAVRWFWQLRPKSMLVRPDGLLTLNLVDAPAPEEPVHFYPGMSKTHDLLFLFTPPTRTPHDWAAVNNFQSPLFVKCKPSWYCQETLSLGRLVSADYPGYRPEFQNVRKAIDDSFVEQVRVIRELRAKVHDPQRNEDSYHVIHFGDGFHHFVSSSHVGIQWDNCYYSYTHLLAMQYCRTADDLFLDTLREAASFESDISFSWHKSTLGAPRVNPGAYHIGGFTGFDRFLSDSYNFYKPIGMLEAYYLTGDRRYWEAGLTNLRWMLFHNGYNMLNNPRSCGAGLRAAVHGYLATGDLDYLHLARRLTRYAITMYRTYGHFAPVPNSIFMCPNALEGLCIYHELTGDPILSQVLPEMVKADYKTFKRGADSLECGFANFYVAHLAQDKDFLAELTRGMAGRKTVGIKTGEHAIKDFAASRRSVPLLMWYLTDLAAKPTPWAGHIDLGPELPDRADCPRMPAPPMLDGIMSEGEWAKAAELVLIGDPNPRRNLTAATRIRVGHDMKNLYVAVLAAEPSLNRIKCTVQEDGGPVWNDDCVEVYVGPVPRRHCLKLAVNTAGARTVSSRGFDRDKYNVPASRDIPVKAGKTTDGWVLEIAVPLDKIGLSAAPAAGTELGFNLMRIRTPEPAELSTWTGAPNEAESTGTLVLR
ncbi:MAG: exo-rhamnogalacturonan lyase family protein [Kiritimatiellia bacterium]